MSFRRLTVFLSSTGKDLGAYRQAVITHMAAADAFVCDHMEVFGARGSGPRALCRTKVQTADVLVGLIGHYRGWEPDAAEPDPDTRSITEMEYDWAGDKKITRLMYVVPDAVPLDPALTMTAEHAQRQVEFRQRVIGANDHTHDIRFFDGRFTSPADFAAAVSTALGNVLYGRMLAAIDAAKQSGIATGSAVGPSPVPEAAPAEPTDKPAAALATFAADPDLDAVLRAPSGFDLAALEAAVSARADRRLADARTHEAESRASRRAAAADFGRLADLLGLTDAAKAVSFAERATSESRPRHTRPPCQGRPRQRQMAARPLRLAQ